MDYTQTSFKRIMGPTGGASTSTSGGGMKILGYGGGGGSNPYGESALKKREERDIETKAQREMEARTPFEAKRAIAEAKQEREILKERERQFFTGPRAQEAVAQGRPLTTKDWENERVRLAGLNPGKNLNEMRAEERNMWLEKAGVFR